jgi:hypothetical protein
MTRTTKQMEKLRRDYRAGLLWLKDASKQLDPEDHKQLVKYREAKPTDCFVFSQSYCMSFLDRHKYL